MLLMLQGLNVACQISQHGVSRMGGSVVEVCDKMSTLLFISCERAPSCCLTNPVCGYERHWMVSFAL